MEVWQFTEGKFENCQQGLEFQYDVSGLSSVYYTQKLAHLTNAFYIAIQIRQRFFKYDKIFVSP